MADNTVLVNMKVVSDISDVVSNVGAIQKSFSKLKLPEKLGEGLNKNITEFYKEYDKYQKKVAEGLKTQGDYNQVEKSLNRMKSLYETIGKEATKVTKLDLDSLLDLGSGDFKRIADDISEVVQQINQVKIDPSAITDQMKALRGALKGDKFSKEGGLLDQLIGNVRSGNLLEAKKVFKELQAEAQRIMPKKDADGNFIAKMVGKLNPTNAKAVTNALKEMGVVFDATDDKINPLNKRLEELQKELQDTKNDATGKILGDANDFNEYGKGVESVTESLKKMHQEEFNFNRQAQDIDRQIQSYFGLSQMIRKVGDIARDAFATVKDLDKAMTETAVVTNFDVGDMWDMLPTYTAQANQLGSTIKDVYEAATLYYQQGLNTNQAMGLANETLKMARIAGLDATEATNMMTAALRGFNMEVNQMSAQKINDIYSELAAITASDTKEIGSAMERTASIANAANMEFATTSAFLAQMIETTREAPENLGTAMKTIVARFQEMKQDPTKLVDSEGVAMDVNKVDKALKTIGVSLTNTKGEFRDLDDVFLDISAKWDSLSQGQQRYIATIAAGSRQQSRFIAMMSNYERTMELVDAANNSAGASQRQFEKTLDSMEAKLNMLKNAWDQFTMGLMNNQIIKFGVDRLTDAFTIVNKFIDILGKIPPKPFEGITKSVLTLVTTLGMLQFGKKASRGLVMGGAAWWKGEEGGFGKNFMSGFSGQAAKAGTADGQVYAQNFNNALKKGQFKEIFNLTKDRSKEIYASQHLTGEYANTFGAAFSQFSAKELSANWTPQIEAEIRSAFQRATANVDLTQYGVKDADEYLNGMISELKSGKSSADTEAKILSEMTDGKVDLNSIGVNQMSEDINNLNNSLLKAGSSLQSFGAALQDTPLAPFGAILSKVGMLITGFGGAIEIAVAAGTAAVGYFVSAWAAGVPLVTAGLKAIGVGFKTLFAEMGPIGWAILAIMGIVAAVKGVDALWESQAEKLEKITDAAAAASEAYDSAKQETSELADAIEQIKANEDAFDGLVVGTAAFNEQLVNANEQIMELIKKYPMLMDADKNYVTTDKNGLMHINDEGLNAIKEYQKQRQANASALNLIQTADLNSEEIRQKAEQMRKVKGTDTTETLKQRQQEADLLEQQAKAQADMAKVNAVNTALVDKEIHNREKISAIMAEQYDARKDAVNLEGESIHDLKQEYADFYGYKYDKSTKKLTDVEGNKIDVDKATIEDAVKEIRVITNFETDGKSLDSMLNSIDSKFSNALGDTFVESGNLFSDIMSNNIDTDSDLLENLITNPDKLQGAVDALSEKEIAAVLGVSANAVAEAPDKYKDELTDKLAEKAANIAETQAQSYADLASMLAKTTSTDISQLIDENGQATTNAQKANQQAIKEQLDKLTTEQKNTLSSIGNALSESAGVETMRTFIRQATDIYTKGTQESIAALDNIIQDVNWSSPTARLKAYNDMINSADKDVQNLGNSLRNSSESSNLLGEAFEEFYDSSDFQEIAENMDKFVDSSGKLNASSIQEMAKECGSLNNLLDTGAISAGGVAAALNAMGKDGNITILDLNENLLKFLSTANQLDDVLSEAHSLIENFDWGVDTGESEDFAKDSTKKWKELYDNGEFGNQQLENYAKFVLGQERWNKELERSGGNIEKALDSMSGDILKYSDGFEQAWIDMANSNAKKYQDVHYGENGDIIWDTKGKTTQELVDWLAETRGITQEWAKLMVEDFANYSYDFKTELASNDYAAALKNGDYIEAHKGADNITNITQSEVAALAAAQNKTEEEILKDIQKYGKISEDELNVIKNIDENGNALMGTGDIASFNTQYSQAELGKDTTQSWISQYIAKTPQGEKIENSTELKSAISAAIADGFTAEQANEMARTEALKAIEDGAQIFYDGVELHKEDLEDSQTFAEKIAEITENSRWNAVGEAIAQGYIAYIKGNETLDSPPTTPSSSGSTDRSGTYEPDPYSEKQEELYSRGGEKIKQGLQNFWAGIKNAIETDNSVEDPKVKAKEKAQQDYEKWKQGLDEGAKAAQVQKLSGGITEEAKAQTKARFEEMWSAIKEAFTSGPGERPEVEASTKAKSIWDSIWKNVKKVFTSGNSSTPTKDNKNNSQSIEPTPAQGKLAVTYTGEIANTEELKASLQQQIASLLALITTQQSKLSATATVNVKQGTIEKPKTQKAVVDYTKGKQAKAEKQTTTVDYKLGKQANPKDKTAAVNYTLGSQVNPKPKTVDISPHFIGDWTKTITLKPSGAKGINNKITTTALPNLGSLAKGSRYGRLGPKGKGGLTLTGEKGFEIAWLPDESRSMILGVDGPQMINLPANAVVYTHEQSKDILRKRQEIEAGSHAGRKTKTNKKSGKKNKKKSGKKSKSKKGNSSSSSSSSSSVINNFSIEEVVRFDIDRKLETLTANIDKITKSIDKKLEKIGTKASDISAEVAQQVKNLEAVKKNNEALVASYEKDLKALDTGTYKTKISYDVGGTKNKNKEETINLSNYIYQDSEGNYQIDRDKIAGAGSKAKQEAIFKAAESALSNLVSGLQKAKDAAADAAEKIEELGKKTAEAFWLWENELTEVYTLSQQIGAQTSMQDRFSSQISLELARLKTGFGDAAKSIAIMTQVNTRNNKSLTEQISKQKTMIEARERELDAYADGTDELEKLLNFRNKSIGNGPNQFSTQAEKDAAVAAAKERFDAVTIARKYLTNFRKNDDGSLNYEINWQQFNKDANSGQLNDKTAEAVKKYFDELDSANTEYNNAIKEQTDTITQVYENLQEYQEYIIDFEDTLLKQLDEQTQKNLDNQKKLNDSLNSAFKDLIDEVKRKLDERRQQEDNRKTETEISQKQQRLAALRADTSGGHQVEIAQLQKEISESQQSYQRTLEDQLLNKLQLQGDEAAKQRERQIDLAEASLAINQSNNKELIEMWLKDPAKYKEEIKSAWMEAQDYDSKGLLAQQQLNSTFASSFAELTNAVIQSEFGEEELQKALNANTIVDTLKTLGENTAAAQESTANFRQSIIDAFNNMANVLGVQSTALKDVAHHNTIEGTNAAGTVSEKKASSLKSKGATKQETISAGATKAVADKLYGPDKTTPTTTTPTVDIWTKVKETFRTMSLDNTSGKINPLGKAALAEAKKHKGEKVAIQNQDARVGASGEIYWDRKGTVRKWNPETGQIYQFPYNEKTYIKEANPKVSPYVNEEFRESLHTHKVKGYRTGGLADYTGPAWLDGTPSKPELVLNAQDTKNFMALKDVLAHAIGSTNNINNSYGGETTYEININVDHINNDYDVDKIAKRVREDIVKGANYRNVTQVRNFR